MERASDANYVPTADENWKFAIRPLVLVTEIFCDSEFLSLEIRIRRQFWCTTRTSKANGGCNGNTENPNFFI